MKSTGSVVTYLIFEFSFQHVLFTCIHYYVCIVHILCENALLFSLEYLTRSSQLYLGPKYNCEAPRGPLRGHREASNSLAPALYVHRYSRLAARNVTTKERKQRQK